MAAQRSIRISDAAVDDDEVPPPETSERAREAHALVDRAAGLVREVTEALGTALEGTQESSADVHSKLDDLAEVATSLEALADSPPPTESAPESTLAAGLSSSEKLGADLLTKSEEEVAILAAKGLTNAEISDALFISTNTVKTHLARVFAKLGVSSRRELTRRATRESP